MPPREDSEKGADDARLISEILSSKDPERACEILVRKHWRGLVGWIQIRVHNLGDAEEIAQETFVKAFRSLESLKYPKSFLAWILRIAGNLTTDFVRRRKSVQSLDVLMEEGRTPCATQNGSALDLEQQELLREVLEAVASLPEKYRIVVTLRYHMGMSAREIAEQLDEPEGTVRNRIFRALEKVRRILRGQAGKRSPPWGSSIGIQEK